MAWRRKVSRPAVDLKPSRGEVAQHQCQACSASVTVTPPGLQPGCRHFDRSKVISVVRWGLRLCHRDAAE